MPESPGWHPGQGATRLTASHEETHPLEVAGVYAILELARQVGRVADALTQPTQPAPPDAGDMMLHPDEAQLLGDHPDYVTRIAADAVAREQDQTPTEQGYREPTSPPPTAEDAIRSSWGGAARCTSQHTTDTASGGWRLRCEQPEDHAGMHAARAPGTDRVHGWGPADEPTPPDGHRCESVASVREAGRPLTIRCELARDHDGRHRGHHPDQDSARLTWTDNPADNDTTETSIA